VIKIFREHIYNDMGYSSNTLEMGVEDKKKETEDNETEHYLTNFSKTSIKRIILESH